MTEPGKHAWLESVVRRNDRDLKHYLSQHVGIRAEVEDLAQEIYLRLLRVDRTDLIRSPEADDTAAAVISVARKMACRSDGPSARLAS